MASQYEEFIASKLRFDSPEGLDNIGPITPALYPFQRDIVRWALGLGRAAIFADCGLGKTIIQLEWARHISERVGPVLILAPLAVAQQTKAEAVRFGIPGVEVLRERLDGDQPAITVTNYEMLHHFEAGDYAGIVLDESSILKNFTGKIRNQIIDSFDRTQFRLACTATPSPNDHVELGNHAHFLGVMTTPDMLATFYIHDSHGASTAKWRLKGHARADYWRWVCTWAVSISSPADLGYSSDGYDLPPITVHDVIVESGIRPPGTLFAFEAKTLLERRRARKVTIDKRVEATADVVREKGGRWILWCGLNAESQALTQSIAGAVELTGSMPAAKKMAVLESFGAGEIEVLVTKPSIAGFGLNWQHCHQMAFVGLSDSYEQYYQATRRCWRFGQESPVDVYVVTSDMEGAVSANIERKEAQDHEMRAAMTGALKEHGMLQGTRSASDYVRETESGEGWKMYLGDCADAVADMASDSIDYSIFSPPFGALYVFSDSPRDMSNVRTVDEFHEHMTYLIKGLMRVTKPGRLVSVHCANLTTTKFRDGVSGLRDFRGELIRSFQDQGWIYHAEVCIWKDPVSAMLRTKAQGLLYKQLRKDSAMSRQGVPDYLITFRKPGVNVEPITKTYESYPLDDWREVASPVWMTVRQLHTLQRDSARPAADEKHIAPLQLDVIERALRLWTNKGDLVLSPFAGIGSEGYASLEMGRRFVGVELKRSYYDQAVKNLRGLSENVQLGLFGGE